VKTKRLRCSECGDTHPEGEFIRHENGRTFRLGSSVNCIAKARCAERDREKKMARFFAEGPRQERRQR